MNDMVKKGYAEKMPKDEVRQDGRIWYLPHHGVFHPQKPDKIRVGFDCSAEYKGEALNKHLLQGLHLTNKLVGVLVRFRRQPVAFMADIESMFLQVHVTEHCRDLLCFLWWENGNLNKEPTRYRMTIHLFGAGSSPGCNFALKKTDDDHEQEFGFAAAEFLRKDFYVDDSLKYVPSTSDAMELIYKTKEVLSAKREILKAAQKDAFSREMEISKLFQEGQDRSSAQQKKRAMKGTSSLYRLDPFLDHDGVLRVGGRIQRGHFTDDIQSSQSSF